MKIKRSQGTEKTTSADRAKKTGQTDGVDFRHLLQSQLEGVKSVSESAPATEVQDRQQGSPELRLQGVQMAEATINSLDSFAQALAEADINGKDLEPFIDALEEENQGLVDIKAQLPDDDPLAKLIEQVAAACYLETAKYRRGDYDD